MSRYFIHVILIVTGLYSCWGGHQARQETPVDSDTSDAVVQERHAPSARVHTNDSIYTESKYIDRAGNAVVIQNSFPRGGGPIDSKSGEIGYSDPSGMHFGLAVFWTRVRNETANPVSLAIAFPADSFALFPTSDAYVKLFLPPDTMTPAKESQYNYGITGLSSYLDTSFYKTSTFQRTLGPQEECQFYVTMLSYNKGGMVRAGLSFIEQDLVYQFSIDQDSATFPCGRIAF